LRWSEGLRFSSPLDASADKLLIDTFAIIFHYAIAIAD